MRRRESEWKGAFDVDLLHFFSGRTDSIGTGSDDEYLTEFFFAVPLLDPPAGHFDSEFGGARYRVTFMTAEAPEDDPLFRYSKEFHFGNPLSHLMPGFQSLPALIFTDNRGRYPYTLAQVQFQSRIANWFDPESPVNIRRDHDSHRAEVLGYPKDEDKVHVLLALNHSLKESGLGQNMRAISYNDVTMFLTRYFRKALGLGQPVLERFVALAAENAFRNAVVEHFLGGRSWSMLERIASVADEVSGRPFSSSKDLLVAVAEVIRRGIKFHVEDRRWIEPFWDGKREIEVEGSKLPVPAAPKPETEIQPTLFVLLYEALLSMGVQVVRETHEGIGALDFRCLYTSPGGQALSVPIEIKLAHHKQLKKGLTRQLPAYVNACKSDVGIFVVFWFKDAKGRFFKKPKNRNREQMMEWLQGEAEALRDIVGFEIVPIVIDASVRTSASRG